MPGFCRRMRYAEIAALLHVVEEDVFDVYVFRSYAHYTWNFLARRPRRREGEAVRRAGRDGLGRNIDYNPSVIPAKAGTQLCLLQTAH